MTRGSQEARVEGAETCDMELQTWDNGQYGQRAERTDWDQWSKMLLWKDEGPRP